jgi:branched-chain amino acid transport system permease protein
MDFLSSTTLQQGINAISSGAIYALFALGYSLVFSILGVLNLAHSAIFMWGAFIGVVALDVEKAPVLVAFTIIALLMCIPAYLSERLIFKKLLPRQSQSQIQDIVRFGLIAMLLILIRLFVAYQISLGLIILSALFVLARFTALKNSIAAERFIHLLIRVLILWLLWLIATPVFQQARANLPETMTIPPFVAFILSIIGGGILSLILEFTAFRPLRERNAARLAQLISSIGAALVLVNIAQFTFEALYNRTEVFYPRDVPLLPFIPTETWIIGDLHITPIRVVILVIAIGLMIALQYMVTRTQVGQQMRAVAFNQRISSLLGIDVSRVYIITFFLAGAFGGASGMLFGMAFLQVTPFMGESIALVGLTAIVLGGLGSINGAVLGGFLVAFLQTASVALGGSSYRNAVVFVLLFLVLLLRPQGILGEPEQNRA